MSVLHHHAAEHQGSEGSSGTPGTTEDQRLSLPAARALAVLRIAFGFTFLWAFLDKLLALGFHTGYDQDGVLDRFGDAAWINGGSPTNGFLAFGAEGPFASFYHSIAGAAWADWSFMLGLLGIGTALLLGIGIRATAASGAVLYLLMWSVALPPETNPVLDDHILGAISLVVLALLGAGHTWGLGQRWSALPVVQKYAVLR